MPSMSRTRRRPHPVPRTRSEWSARYVRSLAEAVRTWRTVSDVERWCFFVGYPRSGHTLVASLLADLRTVPAAVVGFFAGEGGHVRDDLPALIAAARAHRGAGGAPLSDLGTVSDDPAMRRVILDQVAAAVG